MNRFASMYLRSTLALFALACSSDSVTRPVDERSLVLAYTNESSVSCGLVLASLDGQSRSIPHVCGLGVAWSPDGSRLATDEPGGEAAPPSTWIVVADGSLETQVAGSFGFAHPDWSPDGTRLAVVQLGSGYLTVMNVDGSHQQALAAAGGLGYDRPSWSPDGSEILFARTDTLWSVNVSTGVAHVQCVPGLHQMMGARWSPDGTRISVDARAPNKLGEYVMNADGTNQLLLADGSMDGGWASWSPDGTQLVYSSTVNNDDSTLDVFVVPSDGSSAPRNLTHNAKGHASLEPDWARTRANTYQ